MPQNIPSTHSPRTIRLFISSTFRDMWDEREELVKQVAPELRRRCHERGVEFTEVDLRWGIDDQREVLFLCLAEIERCRPYFICHLGGRYGSVPEAINNELMDEHPWLKDEKGKSVTELEVIHGVLNNPDMAQRAFFYFRNPSYSEEIEQRLAQKPGYQPEPPESKTRLEELKTTIRGSGFPLTDNYDNIETFSELVLEEVWAAIDSEYPEGSQPTRLEQEQQDHQAFAATLCKTYISRKHYFTILEEHVTDDGLPLVLLGESGSGKSALIANWVKHYLQHHPNDFVLTRFIGGTPDSTDYLALQRGIMEEIRARYGQASENKEKLVASSLLSDDGQDEEIPTEPEQIRQAFPLWLAKAAVREASEGQRFILILDALNQLSDRDNAPSLGWLPEQTPTSVRLILSTLPGRSLTTLEERGWPTFEIERLEPNEREHFIVHYLARFGKKLSPTQTLHIAHSEQSANPLFLRTLLEELRLFGSHEKLDERIGNYLEAENVETLFIKVLERCEADYDGNRPGLTGEAMSLIWAARYGLSEAELLELLGSDQQALAQANWSPLHLALEESLVNRAGLLNFFHDFVRRAVAQKYLPTKEKKQQVHQRLIDYFQTQPLTWRKVHELPWQLNKIKAWQALYNCLADVPLFSVAYQNNKFEMLDYWRRVEFHSGLNGTGAYAKVLEAPEDFIEHLHPLFQFFKNIHLSDNALILGRAQIDHYRATNDVNNLKDALNNQGTIFFGLNKFSDAMKLFKESEEICQDMGNMESLITPLSNQAGVFFSWGKLEESLELNKKIEHLCNNTGDISHLIESMCTQANIFLKLNKNDCAKSMLNKAKTISAEHNHQYGLIMCLSIQADILVKEEKYKQAFFLLKKQEKICLALGELDQAKAVMMQQVIMLTKGQYFHKAHEVACELTQICIDAGDTDRLYITLPKRFLIEFMLGDFEQAQRSIKHILHLKHYVNQQVKLEKNQTRKLKLLHVFVKQAAKVKKMQPLVLIPTTAIFFFASITLSPWIWLISIHFMVNTTLWFLLRIHRLIYSVSLIGKGDIDQFNLEKRGSKTESISPANFRKQALQLEKRYELSGAMTLYKEHERIARKENDFVSVQAALGKQALLFIDREFYDDACNLLREQEEICINIDNTEGLQATIGNQALIRLKKKELEEALSLFKKQEDICRKSNIQFGLAMSLYNQSKATFDWRDRCTRSNNSDKECNELYKQSLTQAEESHQIAIRNEFHSLERHISKQITIIKACEDARKNGYATRLRTFYFTPVIVIASIYVSPWFWVLGIPATLLSILMLTSHIYVDKFIAWSNK